MKIAVVSDSTAYLDQAFIDEYNISIIPLNVIINQNTYRELFELNSSKFYEIMRTQNELPTTSQPNMGEYVELLEKLKSEGYTDVIAVHLSSGISGCYQGAITANDMVEGITVHSYDSEISCMMQGLYAIKASQLIKQGVNNIDEIIATLDELKKDMKAYFIVDNLNNLKKGGRLTGAQALVGTMLQVKPILHFVDTKIVPYDKVRTKKRAMKLIEDKIKERIKDNEEATIVVIHGNDEETGKAWRDKFQAEYPKAHVRLSYFGPVIGTHLGEGALGVGFTTFPMNLNK